MKNSVYLFNRRRATISLICSIVVTILFVVGISISLINQSKITGYSGAQTFRMFTVDSNLLVALCAILIIPYTIDGIRTGNFHMPRWIVYTLYVGVSGVVITFLISICILAPVGGFYAVMIRGSNLIFHLISPLVMFICFIFVATDHNIKFKYSLIAEAPVLIYAVVYIIMCFVIGVDNGGWSDHYQFDKYLPWPVTLILMIIISFGIVSLIRVLHNKMHKRQKRIIEETYFLLEEFNLRSIEESIKVIAKDDAKRDPGNNEITVPRRVLYFLKDKYNSNKNIEELCELYLKEYLNR